VTRARALHRRYGRAAKGYVRRPVHLHMRVRYAGRNPALRGKRGVIREVGIDDALVQWLPATMPPERVSLDELRSDGA